ncbi:Hypothetical Protein FCC1311_114162, partial [Hondaea fermentalgiana]
MSGHLTNSGGNIVLSNTAAQQITHADTSELQISSGGGVVVDAVTINDQAVSAVTSLGMSGDLSNTAGDILLQSSSAQSITHSGSAGQDLFISSGGNVDVESVRFNTNAVSEVSTLAMTNDLTMSADTASIIHSGATSLTITSQTGEVIIEGVTMTSQALDSVADLTMSGTFTNTGGDLLLSSSSAQAITHSGGAGQDLSISSDGNVDVEGVRFNTNAVTMSGALTNSAGNILLSSTSAQAITHTGGAGQDLSIGSNGNVNVEGVLFNTNAMSEVSTLAMTGDLTLSAAAATITHSGATSLTIISSSGPVVVEGVAMSSQALSDVTDITMTGDLTNSVGDILLTSGSAQSISHTGAGGADLSISSGGNVDIEGVLFNTDAVTMSGDLTNSAGDILLTSSAAQAITHTGAAAADLSISSGGNVNVEGVLFNTNAVTMSGDLTNSAGDILLTSSAAQAITHTGAAAADLSISSGGNVDIQGVLFNGNAMSAVSTLAMTGDLTLSAAAATITHSGTTSLTIISTNGPVIVEGVTMSSQALSAVTDVTMTGDLTNSVGDILLTSTSAQAITHSGGAAQDLSIGSDGNVDIEGVLFNTDAVTMSGDLT